MQIYVNQLASLEMVMMVMIVAEMGPASTVLVEPYGAHSEGSSDVGDDCGLVW